MRRFSTGATRDDDTYKFDFEGFFNPEVLEAYAAYMHKNRLQADGRLRDSDNWQKGMPVSEYVKSLVRHTFELWRVHRGFPVVDKKTGEPVTLMSAACGVMFNVQGLMLELILGRNVVEVEDDRPTS